MVPRMPSRPKDDSVKETGQSHHHNPGQWRGCRDDQTLIDENVKATVLKAANCRTDVMLVYFESISPSDIEKIKSAFFLTHENAAGRRPGS
ncbi:hypothetical protein EVAR_57527_1 [Eumeta japonica]|uniref:Uncharacterized protein n=1 Tax=Eumeta variegata TaxID=151549 RepID=A0A4C1Y1L8_EUMVA|nr:hypothetical protein EVAR_57527_1 [Eumeta japonica]